MKMVQTRLPDEMVDLLSERCKQMDVSRQDFVSLAIQNMINITKKGKLPTANDFKLLSDG